MGHQLIAEPYLSIWGFGIPHRVGSMAFLSLFFLFLYVLNSVYMKMMLLLLIIQETFIQCGWKSFCLKDRACVKAHRGSFEEHVAAPFT